MLICESTTMVGATTTNTKLVQMKHNQLKKNDGHCRVAVAHAEMERLTSPIGEYWVSMLPIFALALSDRLVRQIRIQLLSNAFFNPLLRDWFNFRPRVSYFCLKNDSSILSVVILLCLTWEVDILPFLIDLMVGEEVMQVSKPELSFRCLSMYLGFDCYGQIKSSYKTISGTRDQSGDYSEGLKSDSSRAVSLATRCWRKFQTCVGGVTLVCSGKVACHLIDGKRQLLPTLCSCWLLVCQYAQSWLRFDCWGIFTVLPRYYMQMDVNLSNID